MTQIERLRHLLKNFGIQFLEIISEDYHRVNFRITRSPILVSFIFDRCGKFRESNIMLPRIWTEQRNFILSKNRYYVVAGDYK